MTCKETPPTDIEFLGFLGQRYRRLSAPNEEIRIDGGRPDEDRAWPDATTWRAFWSTVDALGVWGWAPEYGTGVKDGAPWQLQLAHAGRTLLVRGNGAEEYAPPGFRRLCLAFDDLANGALLSADERTRLACGFQLSVSIVMTEPRSISASDRHPTKLALDRALIGARFISYSCRGDRNGWTWIAADASVLRAAAQGLAASADQPEAELLDFTTGSVERL